MPHPQCYFCQAPATHIIDATAQGKVLGRWPVCEECLEAKRVPPSSVVVLPADLPAIVAAEVCWCPHAATHDVLLAWCPQHGRLLP